MRKAILFDLDGVLADSKKAHLKAFNQVCESKGIILTKEELKNIFGFSTEHGLQQVCKKRGLTGQIDEWAKEKKQLALLFLKKSKLFPGAEDFLKYAKGKYKIALASSSSKEEVEAVLKENLKLFDAVLTRESVKKQKPDPEIYKKTAKQLKVKPSDCIVIEDSIAGVESAKRAGMFCIAVLNSYPAKELKNADLIVNDLNDVRIKEIC